MATFGFLCRSGAQGREAGRPAGGGANKIRVGDQLEGRQSTRPHRAADASRPRRRGDRVKRREFITLLGGAAAAWPLAARAQQAGKTHRIGFLGSATPAGSAKTVESLRAGLRELGYVEGTNIGIEFRWAEGNYDRLPRLV